MRWRKPIFPSQLRSITGNLPPQLLCSPLLCSCSASSPSRHGRCGCRRRGAQNDIVLDSGWAGWYLRQSSGCSPDRRVVVFCYALLSRLILPDCGISSSLQWLYLFCWRRARCIPAVASYSAYPAYPAYLSLLQHSSPRAILSAPVTLSLLLAAGPLHTRPLVL